MSRKQPLHFDPIGEAAKNWANAGWADQADGMALVTSVMRVQQILLARVDEALGPFNLSFARFEVLMLLQFSRSGQMPLGKIGRRLQVHPASVTNAIDRLERDSLVARRPHPSDGRATLASITEAGRKVAAQAVGALNQQVFGDIGLPDAETHGVVAALGILRANAHDFEPPTPAA